MGARRGVSPGLEEEKAVFLHNRMEVTLLSDQELTKQLTDLVDNFTLLDILSKEEQEDVLNNKIDDIKKKNEERARRHQEIEADKKLASSTGSSVTSPPSSTCSSSSGSSSSYQSPSQTNTTSRSANSSPSPATQQQQQQQRLQARSQQTASPLSHQLAGQVLPSSGTKQQGRRGDTSSPLTLNNQSTLPTEGVVGARQQRLVEQRSNTSSPFSEASVGSVGEKNLEKMAEPKRTLSSPSEDQPRYEFINIELLNAGRGLGFGLVGSHGIGVVVKTIVAGGAAEQDGRLDSGDVVAQINDINLEGKTRDEVYNILKGTVGMVRLKVKRKVAQSGRAQMKKDAQQARKDKRPTLIVTFPNDCSPVIESPRHKIHSPPHPEGSGGPMGEQGQGQGQGGRGRGRGRGRGGRGRGGGGNDGRSVKMGWEENKGQQDYTSKRKENYDRVEAEIQAMREEYERGKASGNGDPSQAHHHHPRSSQGGFLDDPGRYGPQQPYHQEHHRGDTDRHDGNRRNQRSWGGPTIDDVRSSMTRSRGRPPRRQQYGAPRSKMEMSMSMTGKERRDYEVWRKERDEVEQQRMSRQKESSGEWRREWDREKVPGDSWDDHRGGHQQGRGNYYGDGPPRGYRGRGRGHGRGRGRDFNNPNDRRSQDSPPQGSQTSPPQALQAHASQPHASQPQSLQPQVSQPQAVHPQASQPQASQPQSDEEKRVDPLSGPIGQWQAPARVDNWEMEISPKSKTESWLASTDSDKPSEALGVAIGQWEPPPPTSAGQVDVPVEDQVVQPQPLSAEISARKMADGGVDQWPASTGQVWNGTSSHAGKPSSRKENELRLDHLPEPSGFSSPTSPGSRSSASLPTPTHIDWATCGGDSGEADYGMWKAPEEESAFSYNYHPSEADSWQQNKSSEVDALVPSTGISGSEADGQTKQSDIGPQIEGEHVSQSEHIGDSNDNDQSDVQVGNPRTPSQDPAQDECEDTEADQAAESGSGEGTSQRTVAPCETPLQDAPESESAEGEAQRWTAESAVADSHDAPEAEAAAEDNKTSATDSSTKEE
eukprot:XP_011680083.1 PREDICTED: uncharacterized protein LOC575508 isoform X2 [Strongylocentrotus purpuratus]